MAYLVGIAGGSASGKTTFINKLQQAFDASQLQVLSQDHYYKPLHEQTRDDMGEVNFDLPESINTKQFLQDLETLESGNELVIEEYVFNNPSKQQQWITIKPAAIIVVEGIFILENKAVADKLDLKLFIDADEDIKLARRLERDLNERGLSREIIHYQWHNHVKPSYEKFLLPYKGMVDMVIMNNTHFENSLKVIIDHLNKVILG